MQPEAKKLVIVLGPTAVGKSVTGIYLAKKFDGEIINCDSMQVYKGFDIGTDKPPFNLREDIPHHLMDVADPSQQFTAADFVRKALEAMDIIGRNNRIPFIVGGTGLYLKALLDGLFPGPGRDSRLRQKLEEEARTTGLESLRKKLEAVDPDYAGKIGRTDKMRIIRALEVFTLTRKPISQHFLDTESFVKDFHILKIGLKLVRELLYRRIEDRVERMFERGIIREVKQLLAQGVDELAPPFRALGYKYVLSHLKDEISLEEAIALTKTDTRHYAKRQMTWFLKMEGIAWFSPDDLGSMTEYIRENLAN